MIPKLMVLFAIWGIAAPYVVQLPTVPAIIEVVDHVVPGLIILLVAAVMFRSTIPPLIPALAALLAAFWMVATHVALVRDALRGFPTMATALFHSVPGAVLFALTTVLAVRAYRLAPD